MSRPLAAVILAAGRGTRMCSQKPKALHPIAGKPMLGHLLETVAALGVCQGVVVGGYRIDLLKKYLEELAAGNRSGLCWGLVHQKEQLGSGHAVDQAASFFSKFNGKLLVLYCDTPLVSVETLRMLLKAAQSRSAVAAMLTMELENPTGYGRVIRGAEDSALGVVEENDASPEEKLIREVNVGAYVFDSKKVFSALKCVPRNPKKNEYYLTDVVKILAGSGRVECVKAAKAEELLGVNSRQDLSVLEATMQQRIQKHWMERGVTIPSPQNTMIDADVRIGQDTVLLPGTILEEGSVIGRDCVVGPYARIRGKSVIGDGSVIGNFVEVVRSRVGKRARIKHLSYLGDAQVGSDVNIGAGSITANYDGKTKHRTLIGDEAQIGSGTVLVAPVKIGARAVTGAGAVVTKGATVKAGSVWVGIPAKPLKK